MNTPDNHTDFPDALRWQLRALRQDAMPSHDLWPGIARAIAEPARPRWVPMLAQAAAVVLLVGGFAAFGLVLAALGIFAVVSYSVSERTREIGIRMALGARRRDIQSQFLIEALTLSVIGGFFGVLVGLLISAGIGRLAGWGFIFDPATIAVATVFSLVVGIVFGVWPARQAARLDPVVALRFE